MSKHIGSSVDDLLKEEGIFEKAQAQAVKEVVAWQLAEVLKKAVEPPASACDDRPPRHD